MFGSVVAILRLQTCYAPGSLQSRTIGVGTSPRETETPES
jgi:hypothetical protein